MDEKNGEVFDHHAELFAQMSSSSGNDSLRDFMSGMIESNATAKTVSVPANQPTSLTPQGNPWYQGFPMGGSTGIIVNHNRSGFGLPLSAAAPDHPPTEVPNTSALLDSLVKSMPPSEGVLDHYSSSPIANKGLILESRSLGGDTVSHFSNSLFGGLCRFNSEKVTQDLLENIGKLDSSELLLKCSEYGENVAWNGLVCDPSNNLSFQSQSRLTQSSVDKNGNSALFGSSNVDKMNSNLPSEQFGHNNFVARLSPSASVETSVRTPATSYESASPLSNNRTPIRSDESISPMGSGHTPLRVEESTSPLTSMKTPLRAEEGSPMGRTPSQVEESFSPVGSTNSLPTSNSPSHKANGQLMQGFDTYSPPSVFKGRSPTSDAGPARESPGKRDDGYHVSEKEANVSKSEGPSEEVNRLTGPCEAEEKEETDEKLPVPFASAQRVDDPLANKKSGKRTFLSKKHEGSETPEAKTEYLNAVPESDAGAGRAEERRRGSVSYSEDATFRPHFFNPSRRRRRRSENSSEFGVRRRNKKKVTIYQSSMSPEETGIKLKIKMASAFRPIRQQKKRRSRKHYVSDEDDEERTVTTKRPRKTVRFSGSQKEMEATEQTEWGSKIPADVLQKIFGMVVEEQGCVPSLVRFSYVCKLWNSVANRTELWQNIDLSSPYIKQKCKIDRYFRWLLENRLENIRELNLSGWKFSNITMVLSLIGTHCTEIESIGLAGWQGLHYEHLKSLLQDCPRLGKLDLSDVSPESKSANSAVSQKSITFLTQTMGERLTQLILAHNTLTCLPQTITSLATHCPNLQVLDLSNVRRVSHTEFALNIEHLQEGCRKLKVLRITNSCITLANVPLEKQVASPGFPNLEELSIAGHQGTESLRITSVMDDTCVERILKTSHKLKLLDVRGCTRVTDSSLVRVPAWDIQHLFLSGCYVTRQCGSGLELIAQKWSHSLVEVDLAWTTVTDDLNAAIMAFAEKGAESPLRVMNLCGSSVTLEPVKALLNKCTKLESLNLQSCRGLPRGVKRLYENEQLTELRNMLEKRDRDSGASEGEDRRESECEGRTKESPIYSTNTRSDDFVT